MPASGAARYRVLEWLMWQVGGPGPMFAQVHYYSKFNKGKVPLAEERFMKEARRLYSVLDKRLSDREFVADDYSIADIAIWPWVSRFEWQSIALQDYPNVLRLVCGHREAARSSTRLQGSEGRGRRPVAVTARKRAPPASSLRRLRVAGNLRIPIGEGAVGVALPCPDVEFVKRRQAIAVRLADVVRQVTIQCWRTAVGVQARPIGGEHDELDADEAYAPSRCGS